MDRVKHRCPKWARSWKYKALFLKIYKRAAFKNHFAIKRGRDDRWEVDHIVPLKGENVCGLHVPWNLHVIHKVINRTKGIMVAPEWLPKDTEAERKARNAASAEKRQQEQQKRRLLLRARANHQWDNLF